MGDVFLSTVPAVVFWGAEEATIGRQEEGKVKVYMYTFPLSSSGCPYPYLHRIPLPLLLINPSSHSLPSTPASGIYIVSICLCWCMYMYMYLHQVLHLHCIYMWHTYRVLYLTSQILWKLESFGKFVQWNFDTPSPKSTITWAFRNHAFRHWASMIVYFKIQVARSTTSVLQKYLVVY